MKTFFIKYEKLKGNIFICIKFCFTSIYVIKNIKKPTQIRVGYTSYKMS